MKAILFDIGRVLVGYDHAQTVAGLASVCAQGAADPEVIESLLAAVSADLTLGRMETESLHACFRSNADAIADADAFVAAFCAGISRDEEALAYALQLERRADLKVGVISNTNETHVRWLDANVPELRTFSLVIMSNEVGIAKPEPVLFRLALELLGVEARHALFVDDLQENVAAAQALGICVILHRDWAQTRPLIEAWLEQP